MALSTNIILFTICSVRRFHSAVPSGDLWWFVKDIADFKSHRIGLSFLWGQLSEHRPVLPRLILWTDLQFFRFRGIFAIFCSFVFQASEALLLCFAFWRAGKNNLASKLAYAALVFGMMFSSSQIDNLALPLQVQFPLGFFMSSVSIFLILRDCETIGGNWVAMFLALVAAACGTLSLGNGLLVWPVLLLICVIEHASLRTVCTVTIAGFAIWVIYFIGYYSPPENANPLASLAHPVNVAAFAFTFLVSVMSSKPFPLAGILGLCSLSIAAVGLGLYIRARSDFWKLRAFFVYLALYGIATAFIAALGRLNYGLLEAAVPRYRTPALIFWAAILGLGSSWWNGRAGEIGRSLGTPILAVLFMVIFVIPAQRLPVERFARLSNTINDGGIALAFDATDKAYSQLFSLRPDLVRDYAPFLRENRLSLFADRLFTARGEPLTSLFLKTFPQECSGSVEGLEPLEDTEEETGRVFGSSWLRNESHGPAIVVLADDKGIIIGLAQGVEPQANFAAYFLNRTMLTTRWAGYFHAEPTSRIIAAYAVLADRETLCPLGQVKLHP
ncbi:MAG: hypothetical protein ACLP07_11525 [Terracidiphilus sp.]